MSGVIEHRRPPPFWTFALIGAVVAISVYAGVGPPGVLLPRGTDCELGSTIGTYTIWAPTGLLNIPDGGNVGYDSTAGQLNYSFTSGSLTVGGLRPVSGAGGGGAGETAPQAGIFASYADWNFTFYRTANASRVGAASDPCTQPYVASFALANGFCWSEFSIIPIPDNSTDSAEPHVWNATTGTNSTYNPECPVRTPGTYVWFNSTLNLGGSGVAKPFRWDLCNDLENQTLMLETVARLPVVVTVPFGGGSISATGFLTWDGSGDSGIPTATYNLPGGWVWTIGPVGPVSSAVDPLAASIPGLLAFERSAC